MECFDLRMKSSVGRINAVAPAGDIDQVVALRSISVSTFYFGCACVFFF